MKIGLFTTALLSVTLAAGAASAQTIDQRHGDQQARVAQGVGSGELTRHETRGIERQQRSIDRQERRMRYRDGGRLTARDRAVLRHRENRASRHIYRAKHNGRVS